MYFDALLTHRDNIIRWIKDDWTIRFLYREQEDISQSIIDQNQKVVSQQTVNKAK